MRDRGDGDFQALGFTGGSHGAGRTCPGPADFEGLVESFDEEFVFFVVQIAVQIEFFQFDCRLPGRRLALLFESPYFMAGAHENTKKAGIF